MRNMHSTDLATLEGAIQVDTSTESEIELAKPVPVCRGLIFQTAVKLCCCTHKHLHLEAALEAVQSSASPSCKQLLVEISGH